MAGLRSRRGCADQQFTVEFEPKQSRYPHWFMPIPSHTTTGTAMIGYMAPTCL